MQEYFSEHVKQIWSQTDKITKYIYKYDRINNQQFNNSLAYKYKLSL